MSLNGSVLSKTENSALAQGVDQLTRLYQSGDEAGVQSALDGEFVEHKEELTRLLPAIRLLADLGAQQDHSTTAADTRHSFQGVIGTLGDFRLLREIGRGGMGVVYEAEQISLGRCVALKVLPMAGVLDPRQLQRFKYEAQAAAGLNHPHIVPVYAVGCERGVHYYAMQFIDGLSLDRVIGGKSEISTKSAETHPLAFLSTERTNDPAFFRRIAELGIQAAEALHYAHELGVIHRDIKPGNLVVDQRGQLWITDFGLARIDGAANLTMTGDMLGTLRYMSPEQASGSPLGIDHRTDVYSLGATLYELLALHPAMDGERREIILRQITDDDPLPLKRHNPQIPADLETIILKSLAKEPAERYATAADLAADLRRFRDNQTINARRPTVSQRAVKWARRNRPVVITAAFAMLLLTGVVGGILGWWARDRAIQHAQIEQLKGDAAKAHRELGIALHDQRKFDQAIAAFEKPAALQPGSAEHHHNLGTVLYQGGRIEEAIGEFRRAIELDPTHAKAHNNLAVIMQALGELDEAAVEFRRAIALKPDYPHPHFELGVLLGTQNKNVEAAEEFRRVIALQPEHFQAHFNLAVALLEQGEFVEALGIFARAHAIHSSEETQYLRTKVYVESAMRMVQLEPRLQAVRVRDVEPIDAKEAVDFATACRYKGFHSAAVRLYSTAFGHDPTLAGQGIDDTHRYGAAQCALLAAKGQGKDAVSLSESEIRGLRDQAYQWLQDDLRGLEAEIKSSDSGRKQTAKGTLIYWQRDARLAGVREAVDLAELETTEREAWKLLWQEVAQLAKGIAPRDEK